MISRGALGNPWIFKEILEQKSYKPTFEEWKEIVLRHIDYQEQYFGKGKLAAILMRKHLLWYVKGFYGAKSFRERFNQVNDLDEARQSLQDFSRQVPSQAKRFEDSEEHLTSSYDPKYEMDRELDRGIGDEGM